jgi:hypothetical protein
MYHRRRHSPGTEEGLVMEFCEHVNKPASSSKRVEFPGQLILSRTLYHVVSLHPLSTS